MTIVSSVLKVGSPVVFFLGYLGVIKPLQFYVRSFIYAILVIVCALYGVVGSTFLTLIGKQGLSQWTVARLFYSLCRVILGIKVIIKNPEVLTNTRPAVFVANHQTELDILILGATFPKYCSVTAKKSLKHYPFLGWFMSLSGSIFIDRTNRNNALATFSEAAKKMKTKRQSVFLFPEGTRSYYQKPGLLPFKKGAFHFAVEAQVPLVPYVVSNYSKIFSFQKRIFTSGTIEVEVLPAYNTAGLGKDDVQKLYNDTFTSMSASVQRLGYGKEFEKKTE